MHVNWLGLATVACALFAAVILVTYLWRRPPLDRATKIWLLLGLGIFPILSAGGANVAGVKATQARKFCGSCHVMIPHASDSEDPHSTSLAAIHGRNPSFGKENCYSCHEDYGMFGLVITKAGGMKHVYYYLTEYHSMPLEQSKHDIRIAKPLPNQNCMACHTTQAPTWQKLPDHASSLDGVRSGAISCASPGCHGYAHPTTKWGKELPMPAPAPHAALDRGAP
jgi:cytochrome c-type protein NapC